jgi:hypothetical protein
VDCHGDKDAHNGSFGWECADCHNTNKWGDAAFDHQATIFPLTGRHRDTTCEKCHVGGVYEGTPTQCVDCHGDDDAHGGSFGWECADCHTTDGWGGAAFDHSGLTDCQSCHTDDKPSGHYSGQCSACHNTNSWGNASFNHSGQTDCQSCHTGDKPNDHYSGQCSECHDTNSWGNVSISHSFPLNHEGANSNCATCHPDSLNEYTCYGCHKHEPQKMQEKHEDKDIFDISDCAACHPNGKKD